jgi:hypothetical protein
VPTAWCRGTIAPRQPWPEFTVVRQRSRKQSLIFAISRSYLPRSVTDSGRRTSFDEVLAAFGHTRDSVAAVEDE